MLAVIDTGRMPVVRPLGASGAGAGRTPFGPTTIGTHPKADHRLSPLAVPPTLPRIVIGGWDDEDEEF